VAITEEGPEVLTRLAEEAAPVPQPQAAPASA
jgi:hypothetical protein